VEYRIAIADSARSKVWDSRQCGRGIHPGERGRVSGVVLKGGEEIQAAIIASNLTPQLTFLNLLESRHLAGGFSGVDPKVSQPGHVLQNQSGTERVANFKAIPETTGRSNRTTMHICPSIEYIERAWDELSRQAVALADDRDDHSDGV